MADRRQRRQALFQRLIGQRGVNQLADILDLAAQRKENVQRVAIDRDDMHPVPDRKAIGLSVGLDHPPPGLTAQRLGDRLGRNAEIGVYPQGEITGSFSGRFGPPLASIARIVWVHVVPDLLGVQTRISPRRGCHVAQRAASVGVPRYARGAGARMVAVLKLRLRITNYEPRIRRRFNNGMTECQTWQARKMNRGSLLKCTQEYTQCDGGEQKLNQDVELAPGKAARDDLSDRHHQQDHPQRPGAEHQALRRQEPV